MRPFDAFVMKYGPQIEEEMMKFLNSKIRGVRDPRQKRVIEEIARFTMSGGKRIRPSLVVLGYAGSKGVIDGRIIKASISIELAHSYLLIHDDIMDRDELRRGRPTVWKVFEGLHKDAYGYEGATHYGFSMAIIAGDLAATYAIQALLQSEYEENAILRAVKLMQDVIEKTGYGQILDMALEKEPLSAVKEEDVLKVNELKTAVYTVEGPLKIGGILARADDDLLEAYSNYAIPVGIAFQLQDDVLGVFGDEAVVGKPVGSDIREGKRTLLVIKAWESATPEQRRVLEKVLGNREASREDIEAVRDIIRSSGALDYIKELALKLSSEGMAAIERADVSSDVKEILIDLAKVVVERVK
ncbi:MAG: polyprenyl synthetase family protein [Candidatus Nezhaarchaeota archaeon]|nr:polyprenyl synthetase family protein [Candidatus Nezhaarchaeota archaeon]MCX8141516.1 polyprenyl synthetase family protein [Candidatus Nezhaarchaeota archaeon]MDW8049783.1 polyprenyl synthetase family protein [Nitrososphaerota archaeon]